MFALSRRDASGAHEGASGSVGHRFRTGQPTGRRLARPRALLPDGAVAAFRRWRSRDRVVSGRRAPPAIYRRCGLTVPRCTGTVFGSKGRFASRVGGETLGKAPSRSKGTRGEGNPSFRLDAPSLPSVRYRAPPSSRARRPLLALFLGSRILQDALGDEPRVLPDRRLDLLGDLGVLAQELLGVLAPLPDALAVEGEPGA